MTERQESLACKRRPVKFRLRQFPGRQALFRKLEPFKASGDCHSQGARKLEQIHRASQRVRADWFRDRFSTAVVEFKPFPI